MNVWFCFLEKLRLHIFVNSHWPVLSRFSQVTWWRWQRLVPGLKSSRALRGIRRPAEKRRCWEAPLSLWLHWWPIPRSSAALSPSSSPPKGNMNAVGVSFSWWKWQMFTQAINHLMRKESSNLADTPLLEHSGCCLILLIHFLVSSSGHVIVTNIISTDWSV